ncbi:hypothetical protein HRI_000001400 [Hibiscus trionum]|uniref:Uncharacterized protein n=1 Tax=Hibiscus trionum TaxID=183268 RepID=A0A9W7LGK2_HIBTR|nr:hypothetical protein HRI_000001400 [Hibiscus trionum]
MNAFAEFIDDLEPIDLPAHGENFTWSNLKEHPSFSILDRFLISPEFVSLWPFLFQKSYQGGFPITIQSYSMLTPYNWAPIPFKWFDNWVGDKTLDGNIQGLCNTAKGERIMPILRKCKVVAKDRVNEQ